MTKSIKKIITSSAELWTLTDFISDDLSAYAKKQIFSDTRKGMVTLCLVLFVILAVSTWLYSFLGYDQIYIYSSMVLSILSLHMAFSARIVKQTQVLYLLATTLIVINGVAMVLLAHKSGSFNSALFASVLLLFLVMPLVPWGLREALIIVLLVYGIFTASTLSVVGRFDVETLWILQFVMLGASLTTLVVISRNIVIRRHDIKMRFELEKAHDQMELLSLKDPLTGAWNRRFLEQRFTGIIGNLCQKTQTVYFAVIDINDFKTLNDNFGHDYGDLVLKQLVNNFLQSLSGGEHLVRMGGDEFAVVMASNDAVEALHQAANNLRADPTLLSENTKPEVTVSIGIIEIDCKNSITLQNIYAKADKALYQAKEKKQQHHSEAVIEFYTSG